VAVIGQTAYVTNYFSDTVTVLDLANPEARPKSILPDGSAAPQGKGRTRKAVLEAMTLEKRGEFYFHDASICFQGWQSCASCHPGGGRADGLNWDLLNDGIGNPKNTRSLLLAFETPPAMSTGVRESAHQAVRSGLKHILFTEPNEEIAGAIDAYIRSLKPVPSPRLVDGKLSASALRGEKVFIKAGCAQCHPAPLLPT
jgi:cytochrome c peroxidase